MTQRGTNPTLAAMVHITHSLAPPPAGTRELNLSTTASRMAISKLRKRA